MRTLTNSIIFPTPTIEITTMIGCKVNCDYCPQNLLIKRYHKHSNITRMSFETFSICIDKLPLEVEIHFSGMCEPWLNPDCTKMLLYAANRGHKIVVYTTLVGMTINDFQRIKDIEFQNFVVHLPDDKNNSKIAINKDYLNLVKEVFDHFTDKQDKFDMSCHGPLHPEIVDLVRLNNYKHKCLSKSNKMIDRVGNVSDPNLEHRHHEHAIQCGLCGTNLNRNILLPNGIVLLCCMDYGMEVILGNLRVCDYFDLFRSSEYLNLQNSLHNGENCICRKCNNAIPWERPYHQIYLNSISNTKNDKNLRFCANLAEKCGLDSITVFSPERPVSFSALEIAETIPYFPDISSLLNEPYQPSWSIICEMMAFVPFAIMYLPIPYSQAFGNENFLNNIENLLKDKGLPIDQIGWSIQSTNEEGVLVILSKAIAHIKQKLPPTNFKVVAIISVFNEKDIILPCIEDLNDKGIYVYIVDNWSTDGSFELAKQKEGNGVIGIERWPKSGPSNSYDWKELLHRKAEIAMEIDVDWFIHHDADEIRESAWPSINLRDAFWIVDQLGYNAIDYSVINFFPVDDDFVAGTSFLDHFKYFEFGKRPGHFIQVKAWKKTSEKVDLHSSGGHDVQFEGRKVFPYKFLLRHYPFRTQEQSEGKVFRDRKPRYSHKRKKEGWHTQYDHLQPGTSFIKPTQELTLFSSEFYSKFLIERLSGIGVKEDDMDRKRWEEKKDNKFTDPNRFARPFSMEEGKDSIVFHGYQEFVLFKDHLEVLEIDLNLQKKSRILQPILTEHNLTDRSVMDLGANSGYFCYLALQNHAPKVMALEMDEKYFSGLNKAKRKFLLENLIPISENFEEIGNSADIVIALALIHWIYSCTAGFGSLDKIIRKLADMTNYALIIEWISPDDEAIKFFDHLSWNQDVIEEEYTFKSFQSALERYFNRSVLLGEVSPTRKIYIAYKTENEIYIDSPLPRLKDKELISSRILANDHNINYWSDVYDDGELIYKLTTGNLAAREAEILQELNSQYFPKVLDVQQFDNYSKIKIEKILGKRIKEFKKVVESDREKFLKFINGCFDLLEQLQEKSITHRDIRKENLLVRDDLPVLLDFGWAISPTNHVFTPDELGAEIQTPDGHHNDSYAIGLVINYLNDGLYEEITELAQLMTIPDDQYRITDIGVLREIVNVHQSESFEGIDYQLPVPVNLYLQLTEKALSEETLSRKLHDQEQKVLFYALSKSWRFTRPLRKIMKLIRGNKDDIPVH